MPEQLNYLKNQGSAFAHNKKKRGLIHLSESSLTEMHQNNRKLPKADEHLEKTLVQKTHTASLLTKRESEILELIVAGNTNKEIARQLCRNERTIEYHRNRLMRKLNAHNAADLVKRAIIMGIL